MFPVPVPGCVPSDCPWLCSQGLSLAVFPVTVPGCVPSACQVFPVPVPGCVPSACPWLCSQCLSLAVFPVTVPGCVPSACQVSTLSVCAVPGESNVYTIGYIGKHKVVSTKLPAIGTQMREQIAAGSTTTRLLGEATCLMRPLIPVSLMRPCIPTIYATKS